MNVVYQLHRVVILFEFFCSKIFKTRVFGSAYFSVYPYYLVFLSVQRTAKKFFLLIQDIFSCHALALVQKFLRFSNNICNEAVSVIFAVAWNASPKFLKSNFSVLKSLRMKYLLTAVTDFTLLHSASTFFLYKRNAKITLILYVALECNSTIVCSITSTL